MKKIGSLVACLFALLSFAFAQDADKTAMLKEFTRSSAADGLSLSFVHLNSRTVDVLFEAPGKYALRARANQSTMLYVQGVPEKDVMVDTKFFLEQGGEKADGVVQNIKNFQSTTMVPKGERIDGIIYFQKKVDLTQEFTVGNATTSVVFKLSHEALKLLEPPAKAN
jgi:hypothetical protein